MGVIIACGEHSHGMRTCLADPGSPGFNTERVLKEHSDMGLPPHLKLKVVNQLAACPFCFELAASDRTDCARESLRSSYSQGALRAAWTRIRGSAAHACCTSGLERDSRLPIATNT